MLGTNDFQRTHNNDAWHSAQGLAAIVREIRAAPIEPGMAVPPILIVSPPAITQQRGAIAAKFAGAEHRAAGLAAAQRQVAHNERCAYFDSGSVISASPIDGIHLDAGQHGKLGHALASVVAALIAG
jgi:lysophospholipase L1-like esterase